VSRPSSRPPGEVSAALSPVVSEVVERSGFVLDALEVRAAGRRALVRVVVDTEDVPEVDDGPAVGLDLDAVSALSRDLSTALDAAESDGSTGVPSDAYTLEVTTLGTDRPLTLPRHWRRAWLRRVAITLTDGSTLTARAGGVRDGEPAYVTVAVAPVKGSGPPTLRGIGLDEVTSAAVEVEFKPAPDAEIDILRRARSEWAGTQTDPGTGSENQEETS